jgi:hypothetical protein
MHVPAHRINQHCSQDIGFWVVPESTVSVRWFSLTIALLGYFPASRVLVLSRQRVPRVSRRVFQTTIHSYYSYPYAYL